MLTIARYPNTALAHVGRTRLEASGIDAIVADDATASVAWHLIGALGGVRLMVHNDDADRARRVLESELDDTYEDVPELRDDPDSASGTAEAASHQPAAIEDRRGRQPPELDALTSENAAAIAAAIWRASLVGTYLWPLQLLTAAQLLELWRTRARIWPLLSQRDRRRMAIASVLTLGVVVLLAALVLRLSTFLKGS